ncbi:MAG: hypothetical protein ACUZ8N_01580 [Candidatus Scalindua sp.]
MNEKVINAIFSAIDDVNKQLAESEQLEKGVDIALFGAGSSLDSLGFINLIAAVEYRIEEEFGVTIILRDKISRRDSPLQSIRTLADYISAFLEERVHGRTKI